MTQWAGATKAADEQGLDLYGQRGLAWARRSTKEKVEVIGDP